MPINIGTGKGVSIKNILDQIIEIDKYHNAKVTYDKSKPTMIKKRILDITLAKKLISFESKTPLNIGLTKTIFWYKENK